MSRIFLTFLNLVGLILTLLPDFQIRGQVAAEEAERDHAATEAVTVSAEKENGLFVTDVNDEICSDEEYIKEISAHADGGPLSCVCSRDTPAPARVCRIALNHLPQLLRTHFKSFRKFQKFQKKTLKSGGQRGSPMFLGC